MKLSLCIGGSTHTKPVERASLVPSFLDSDILDFTSDADPAVPAKSTMPPLPPPPPSDSVDLLDGFYDMSVSVPTNTVTTPVAASAPTSRSAAATATTAVTASAVGAAEDDGEVSDHEDPQIEGDDLPQRREEYIKLFMRADIVYASPLTRALQTALASMCGHPALTKHKLTLYR